MGQIDPIRDRIEAGSRCGRDRDVYAVSEPESYHMARTGGHEITILAFFKNFSYSTFQAVIIRIMWYTPKPQVYAP